MGKEKMIRNLIIYLHPTGDQSRGSFDKINNIQSWGWSENYEIVEVICSDSEVLYYPYASIKKIKQVIEIEEPKIKLVEK